MLREVMPTARVIGIIFNAKTTFSSAALERAKAVAVGMQIEILPVPIHDGRDLVSRLDILRGRLASFIVDADGLFMSHRSEIVRFAVANRLPAVYPYREFVDEGGMMSYGPHLIRQCERIASYIDRVLRGTRVAELPIQQPQEFELAVNLTAKALNLTIPPSLLLRADQVIE